MKHRGSHMRVPCTILLVFSWGGVKEPSVLYLHSYPSVYVSTVFSDMMLPYIYPYI